MFVWTELSVVVVDGAHVYGLNGVRMCNVWMGAYTVCAVKLKCPLCASVSLVCRWYVGITA